MTGQQHRQLAPRRQRLQHLLPDRGGRQFESAMNGARRHGEIEIGEPVGRHQGVGSGKGHQHGAVAFHDDGARTRQRQRARYARDSARLRQPP